MSPVHIENETRNIGKPVNWNEDKDGKCDSLSVIDILENDKNRMCSAWQPTIDELKQLNEGGFIWLHIYGQIHPVVALTVGK